MSGKDSVEFRAGKIPVKGGFTRDGILIQGHCDNCRKEKLLNREMGGNEAKLVRYFICFAHLVVGVAYFVMVTQGGLGQYPKFFAEDAGKGISKKSHPGTNLDLPSWLKSFLPNLTSLAILSALNKPKVISADFINFLAATPVNAIAMEFHRTNPPGPGQPFHDAYPRLLHRFEPSSEAHWLEVKPEVKMRSGILFLDDTVLEKPYARKMDSVQHMWSGKHHTVVKGIDLLTMLWTDGDRHLLCDYRIYDKLNDGMSKNDHFGDLLDVAKDRGFQPEYVLFDKWYSSLANLRRIAAIGWLWLSRLKHNRRVNPERSGNRPVSECDISATGTVVHLENYGMVKVFRIISKDGTAEHWATNDLEMNELKRLELAEASWKIEEYHRGIKQVTNVEGCQCRKANAQRAHIGLALRAILVFEKYCFQTGYNGVSTKAIVFQEAVRAFRANPVFRPTEPSTA